MHDMISQWFFLISETTLFKALLFFLSNADFDEKCSQEDDWDVDMSVYYEQGINYSYIYFVYVSYLC